MTILVWYRGQDLRVADHGPLLAAGGAALPVYCGPATGLLGGCLGDLAARLEALGSGLAWLPGDPVAELAKLARDLGARAVFAQAAGGPGARAQESALAEALPCPLRLFSGEALHEPDSRHRVFTAFHRAFLRGAPPAGPAPAPGRLAPLPGSLSRWPAGPLRPDRLAAFLEEGLADYATARDRLDLDGTSGLSVDLHFGTVSVAACYAAAAGRPGAEAWQRQLVWRDFARHLLRTWPQVLAEPFQERFRGFPWAGPGPLFEAWAEGRTGFPVVDAAARQLLETGRVHNRARMIAASFLAKQLQVDYRLGEAHYLAHLDDADAANNNLGWQWSAGCGCDAQPWFRVFNPVLQGRRWDPDGAYVRRWVPELAALPAPAIHAPWLAGLPHGYPPPIVDPAWARARFLAVAKAWLESSRFA